MFQLHFMTGSLATSQEGTETKPSKPQKISKSFSDPKWLLLSGILLKVEMCQNKPWPILQPLSPLKTQLTLSSCLQLKHDFFCISSKFLSGFSCSDEQCRASTLLRLSEAFLWKKAARSWNPQILQHWRQSNSARNTWKMLWFIILAMTTTKKIYRKWCHIPHCCFPTWWMDK